MATSSSDPTAGHIRSLAEPVRSAAWWMVYAARQAGYPLIITSSVRTREEQARLVTTGRSQTMTSKHLQGLAFDVDIFGMDRDDVPQWFWQQLGPWAESSLGLRWGGRWSTLRDYGHFEAP